MSVIRVQNARRCLEDEAEKARKQDIIEKRAAEDRALFERMSRRMRSSEGAFRCQKAGTNSSRCGVDLSGCQRSHIFAASISVGNSDPLHLRAFTAVGIKLGDNLASAIL